MRNKDNAVNHYVFRMLHAFLFSNVSWRQRDAYLSMTCSAEPIEQSVFCPFQSSAVPFLRSLRDGKLVWHRRENRTSNPDSGARDTRCLLRQRFHAPL